MLHIPFYVLYHLFLDLCLIIDVLLSPTNILHHDILILKLYDALPILLFYLYYQNSLYFYNFYYDIFS